MNKYLKLALIPVALTLFGGCASFHNALRNVRHSIERAAKKKAPGPKIVAYGFACRESVNKSRRAAENEAKGQLEAKRIKIENVVMETTPEEERLEDMWLGNSGRNSSSCALTTVYRRKQPPTPKPAPKEVVLSASPDASDAPVASGE